MVTQIYFATSASMLMFDMVFALFFSLAMFSFYMKYYKFFYVFLVLALYTKGPLALALAFVTLVPYIVIKKISLKDLHLIFSFIVFIISLVWFVIVALKEPSFFRYYVIDNNIMRFLGKL
jgi:4-amino-4-deoxy-L-arabinose transferase-like glycosyltransferase